MCCENIKGILTEAGVGMDRIVKVRSTLPNTLYLIYIPFRRHTGSAMGMET
jgi:enamine deaminase RidA (YjgF/YER057c/UK114 family)